MSALRVLSIVLAVCLASTNAFTILDSSLAVQTVIPGAFSEGIIFNSAGDLFYYDDGCLKVFKNAADTPFGGTINFNSVSCVSTINVGFTGVVISQQGRFYLTTGQEINPTTGATVRTAWNSCGAEHGIALDPRDGAIFFSNYGSRMLYRVPNPDLSSTEYNPCGTPFADTNLLDGTGCDGITVGPDGTVYCAGWDKGDVLLISAYSAQTPTGSLIGLSRSGKSAGQGPDGISVCAGDGVSFVITSLSGSHAIGRVNLTGPGGATSTPPYAFSLVATNTGGYNDWTAVDPKGCIWGSTVDGTGGIYRISNADGTCPNCASAQVIATGSCSCSDAKTVSYQGTVDQTNDVSSSGNCVSLSFA